MSTPRSPRTSTIVLSLLGLGLSLAALFSLLPRLRTTTVTRTVTITRPVAETRITTKTVRVDGKEVQAEVPETTHRSVTELRTETVPVGPTAKEKTWLYLIILTGSFLGLFSIGTAATWFYFLLKKNGEAPPVVTEMLKYMVSSFMGILVGFMGGTSLPGDKPANAGGAEPAALTNE